MVPVNSDFPQPSDRAAPRGFYPAIRRSVNLCPDVASHMREISRHDDISVSQHRFGGTTCEPHASAASHADVNVGACDDEVRSKLGRVCHPKRAVRCSLKHQCIPQLSASPRAA
jgi:hypothetical protein